MKNLLLLLGLAQAVCLGQTITGRLIGTVSDQSKAAVPDVELTITNQNTGVIWRVTTDSHGDYIAPALPSGSYRIQVRRQGFRGAQSADNVVSVAQDTRVDFTLEVGSVSETVEVVATAPLVRSTTSEIGETIDHKQVDELPLNGRLFSQLMQLVPGAVPDGPTDAAESTSGSGARSPIQASINGVSYKNGNFTIDGVSNREPANGYINISPPVEAIQEFKVQTNNPSAEFGSFGGAVVNLTIRSGTNAISGFLFEYFRNNDLNARTFFAVTIPPLKSNQFGGGIGGPIRRNKIFYFGDYQGLRLRYGSVQRYTFPTDLMKQGILSPADGFKNVAYDPLNNTAFPNDTIPASRMDKTTRALAALYPQPNIPNSLSVSSSATTGPGVNYQENTVQTNDPDQVDLKLDYNVSDRDHVFLRETYNARTYRNPPPGNIFMQGSENANSGNHNAVAGQTFTPRANLINELRLGFNRFNTFHFAPDYGIAENNILGIPNGNIPGHPETSGIARFDGMGVNQTGGTGSSNALRLTNQYHLTDGLTWVKSNHALKVGADLVRNDTTVTNPDSSGGPGEFKFDGNFTANVVNNAAAKNTGVPWASFVLGLPTTVVRDLVNTFPDVRRYMSGFYVQDDVRVRKNLTINIGLRYELFTLACEHFNRQTNLNLSTGLLDFAQDADCAPHQNLFNKGFAPRVGFAWSPDNGRTAVRSAFGISYSNNVFGANSGALERNYPYFQLFNIAESNQFTPFWQVSVNGLPTPLLPAAGSKSIPVPANIAPYYMPSNFRPDEVVMWNFGIQRQITHTAVLDVAYVGTRGSHLFRSLNIDTPLPAPGNQQVNRPYNSLIPQINTINYRGSSGDSHYNSLQAKFTKRYSSGLFMLLSYTWSKSIDDMNSFWVYNDVLNRGLSSFDRRHNFVASWGYLLPFGPGQKWISHSGRALELLAGGWQLNGISMMRAGDPLAISVQTSQLNTGTGNRAYVTCQHVDTIGSIDKWFDTSCFANPPAYAFGTANPGTAFGPGFINFDLSIFKSERIREKHSIEFRFEAFNAMNAHHFADPITTFGNSSFGKITNTNFPARELQLGLKYRF
jgi:hypothetical protein